MSFTAIRLTWISVMHRAVLANRNLYNVIDRQKAALSDKPPSLSSLQIKHIRSEQRLAKSHPPLVSAPSYDSFASTVSTDDKDARLDAFLDHLASHEVRFADKDLLPLPKGPF